MHQFNQSLFTSVTRLLDYLFNIWEFVALKKIAQKHKILQK